MIELPSAVAATPATSAPSSKVEIVPEKRTLADESGFGLRQVGAETCVQLDALPSGSIYSIRHGPILINQVLASPLSGGIQRLYLRTNSAAVVEIIGPRSTSRFEALSDRLLWWGTIGNLIDYRCECVPHTALKLWFFHIRVWNRSVAPVRFDAVLVQDLALCTRGQARNNELFTSQYLDHAAVRHSDIGHVVMTRQNLLQKSEHTEGHPWLMQGCFPATRGFSTDGFDVFGLRRRDGDDLPEALERESIGSRVRQSEAAYLAIQSAEQSIAPGGRRDCTFFAMFEPDHREPSSPADLHRVRAVVQARDELIEPSGTSADSNGKGVGDLASEPPVRSLFQQADLLRSVCLTPAEVDARFGPTRRHEERSAEGQLLSFFSGDDSCHVVLRAKEIASPRQHGHILRAGTGLTPDNELMSTACYAGGVFASQLTHGNTSLAKLFSCMRDPLNLVRSTGLRMFIRHVGDERWRLLGVPSAFEMSRDRARWHYKLPAEDGPLKTDGFLTVSLVSAVDEPVLTLRAECDGPELHLLLCGEVAAAPVEYDSAPTMEIDRARARFTIRPAADSILGKKQPALAFYVVSATAGVIDAMGGDELLFSDGASRGLPCLTIRTHPTRSFVCSFLGHLDKSGEPRAAALCDKYASPAAADDELDVDSAQFWGELTHRCSVRSDQTAAAAQLNDVLAWFARDALVHLSVPRGLEQANGGAWGVRDVCQGPVEFLLACDQPSAMRDIVCRVFSQQYAGRGDWPQWYMFPPFEEIQSKHCHGDVLIWPLKALCDYLEHSNDAGVLSEKLGFTDEETYQPVGPELPLVGHVDRLIEVIRDSFLPGISLPRYGEGDWDDSLQPADQGLRERMVSSWTSELMFQTLRRYSAALARFGDDQRAGQIGRMAAEIEADFHRYLVPDGVVAGFALFDGEPVRPIEYLLHPSDRRTGLHYRLIPMTRGILSGMFSPEQADAHLRLIDEHLLYPDGARLMDRPTPYRGGLETTFRRAESAAFFGREIGLQYVHAHLRYAEALARLGRADELWRALLVVNPIAVTDVVPGARPRQRNCYFSSSDAAFPDRYSAARDYDKLRRGEIPTDGGWRIYSSGPGIYMNVVIRHLFGLRFHYDCFEIDPVLPPELSGIVCEMSLFDKPVSFEFNVGQGADPSRPIRITLNGEPVSFARANDNPYRPGGARIARAELAGLLRAGGPNVVRVEL